MTSTLKFYIGYNSSLLNQLASKVMIYLFINYCKTLYLRDMRLEFFSSSKVVNVSIYKLL